MATTPNDYATLAEVKDAFDAGGAEIGLTLDPLLTALITRASRLLDRLTRRDPGTFKVTDAEVRYFTGSGKRQLWTGELAGVPSAVAVAESGEVDSAAGTGGTYTAWSATDYLPWPYNALQKGEPFLRLDIDVLNGNKAIWYAFPKAVKITALWGYSATPPDVVTQAVITQTVRWLKRAQQGMADVGAVVDLSQLRYVQKLDPDVAMTVEMYTALSYALPT